MKRAPHALLIAAFGLSALACDGPTPDDHPTDELRFPVSLVADPSGEYLYVANSNFDLAFLGGNLLVIDVDTNRFVPGAAVQMASFAGDIAVLPGDDGQAASLFVASRDDGEANVGGGVITQISVGQGADGAPTLTCALPGPTPNEVPYCAAIGDSPDAPETAGVQTYGLALRPPDDSGRGYLFSTAFDGTFSIFRLTEDRRPERVSQVTLTNGAYGVAVHPITGEVYATTKSADRLFALAIEDDGDEVTVAASGISVTNPTLGTDFGRELTFNRAGTLAFVAYRTPPSLLVLDTSVGSDGRAANQVLGQIPLGAGPAAVAIANSAPGGGELVYVSLYDSDQLAVVDPRRLEVVAIIPMGNGPFDVAVVEKPGVKRAYVTLFEENAIGVIDIDPDSVFYHQEIARIP